MRGQHGLKTYPIHLAGFSLVELMVALTLSLVLMGGIAQSFISSKQSHTMREQVALLTENGRYATESLQRDIRMAGYSGCRTLNSLPPNITANNPPSFSSYNDSLQGFESGTGWTNPTSNTHIAGTDVITINRATGQGVQLTSNMGTTDATIQIGSNPYGIQAGDVLLLTDCESADLFRASSVAQIVGTVTITHTSTANTDVNLSSLYQDDATIMKFSSNTYFVGSNASDGTSLYMIPFESAVAIELVPNVQDLQLEYSIDTNNDQIADDYVDASSVTNWQEVIGVNVGLLQYTSDNIVVEPQTFVFKGANVNPSGDHRLRNSNWMTVGLRNRLN
jgi:type IV pilus assembly protein PilW